MPINNLINQLNPIRRQLRAIRSDLLHQILMLLLILRIRGLGHLTRSNLLLLRRQRRLALIHPDPALEHLLGLLRRILVLPLTEPT
ncbi:hypothetical protein ACFSJD_42985 [Pseudonocardia yunnanensis]|uniref:Uncharacterized protein n=1 Tax=Pseudonocardia yunnanensis TaxID=58107 RepID=A0ABW4F9V1_9PSEU